MTETNRFASQTGLSSNQVAAIAEALVAIELIKASQGELSPAKPISDDYGIDLDVHDETVGRSARLQIKTRTTEDVEPRGLFGFGLVSHRTEASAGHFVVGVLLHMPTNSIVMAWLVPTEELARLATRQKNGWRLTPNASPSSRDKFARFRHRTMDELTLALRDILRSQPAPTDIEEDGAEG